MKRTVSKEALVKIIARHTNMYSKEAISKIIEEDGSKFFEFTGLQFTYLNFGKWLVEE